MTEHPSSTPSRDSDMVHGLVGNIARCERCHTTPRLKENQADMDIGARAEFRVECFCGRSSAWFRKRHLAIRDWQIMQGRLVGWNVCPANESR